VPVVTHEINDRSGVSREPFEVIYLTETFGLRESGETLPFLTLKTFSHRKVIFMFIVVCVLSLLSVAVKLRSNVVQ
jgi:hypothetical protein